MITTIPSEDQRASQNIDDLLIEKCQCAKHLCCRRVIIGATTVAVSLGIAAAVAMRREAMGEELAFSIGSFSILLAAVVCVALAFQCRHLVFGPTGSPLQKHLLYYPASEAAALQEFLHNGHTLLADDGESMPPPRARANGPVLLCATISCDGRMAFCRLMRYEGFGYVPMARDYFYTDADAERVRLFVRQTQKKS